SVVLKPKCSIKRSPLSLSFCLFPNISSSLFSTHCRGHPFSPPPPPASPPPVPKKVPFTVSVHGRSWQDPYHWMSNTNDPDLSEYLNKENAYSEAFMADTGNLQRTLFSEMTRRMPTKISTPPERWGPWLYYQYIPEGKEYPVLYRRLEVEKLNWVKTFLRYVHVGTCRISPDHLYLAYTLDTKGNERFMLQIKDLRSGCIIPNVRVDEYAAQN
ncbi:Prolyl oligopeptidase family protein, partial [Prunus dulcis]